MAKALTSEAGKSSIRAYRHFFEGITFIKTTPSLFVIHFVPFLSMSILPKLLSSLASSIFSVEKRCHCPLVFKLLTCFSAIRHPEVSVFYQMPPHLFGIRAQ
jgi:hypothetical protein